MSETPKCEIPLEQQAGLIKAAIGDLGKVFLRNGFQAESMANVIIGQGINLAIEASGLEMTIADLRDVADQLENALRSIDRNQRICMH